MPVCRRIRRLSPLAAAIGLAVAVLAASVVAARAPAAAQPPPPAGLPLLHNISTMTTARAGALAAEALAGLGFPPGSPDGPQPNDRVVVTGAYVAWIDETGFYGKLNGLWWLSPTIAGDRSFTNRDPVGRPVNVLIVGENGDGAWPTGMRGGEHIEVPNDTPEPHHDPACATEWCAAYSMDEAGAYTDPFIPWWKVCDPGTPSYLDHFAPVEVSVTATSVRLVYEGRLVKTADSATPYTNTTGCRDDWLFPDGVRRPVHLRVGYELSADDPWIDRIQQVRNPAGNPPFEGPYSVIGGFEITTWPNPRPDKAINNFLRPETTDVGDQWLQRTLPGGEWSTGYPAPLGPSDIVLAWLGQPFTMSSVAAFENGRSLRVSHIGPKDNKDVAICMCLYHGTIEMGGGLLHSQSTSLDPADAALPISGGQSSIEAVRRLETARATVIADVAPWAPPTTGPPATAPPSTTPPVVAPAFAG